MVIEFTLCKLGHCKTQRTIQCKVSAINAVQSLTNNYLHYPDNAWSHQLQHYQGLVN